MNRKYFDSQFELKIVNLEGKKASKIKSNIKWKILTSLIMHYSKVWHIHLPCLLECLNNSVIIIITIFKTSDTFTF